MFSFPSGPTFNPGHAAEDDYANRFPDDDEDLDDLEDDEDESIDWDVQDEIEASPAEQLSGLVKAILGAKL